MLWLYDAQGDPSLWTVRYLSSVLQFLNVKICSGNKNIGTAARVGQMHPAVWGNLAIQEGYSCTW